MTQIFYFFTFSIPPYSTIMRLSNEFKLSRPAWFTSTITVIVMYIVEEKEKCNLTLDPEQFQCLIKLKNKITKSIKTSDNFKINSFIWRMRKTKWENICLNYKKTSGHLIQLEQEQQHVLPTNWWWLLGPTCCVELLVWSFSI